MDPETSRKNARKFSYHNLQHIHKSFRIRAEKLLTRHDNLLHRSFHNKSAHTHTDNNILQKTEKIIGPYELHDFFLYHFMKNNLSFEKIKFLALNGFNGIYNEKLIEASLNVFIKKFFQNQFKRSSIPDGPKITEISLSPRGDLKMSSDSSYNSFI